MEQLDVRDPGVAESAVRERGPGDVREMFGEPLSRWPPESATKFGFRSTKPTKAANVDPQLLQRPGRKAANANKSNTPANKSNTSANANKSNTPANASANASANAFAEAPALVAKANRSNR